MAVLLQHVVLHHLAVACQDPAEMERFYSKYFGFKPARVIPIDKGEIVFLRCGEMRIEFFQAKEKAPVAPAGGDGPWYPGFRHMSFKVDDVDAKLAEMGKDAVITLGPFSFDAVIPGWRTVWVSDPEGNIVEISQGYTDQT